MYLLRRFALGFGLLCGVITSQVPEFAQQYRQRLGGALDELTAIIDEFRTDASKYGMDERQAVAALEKNTDQLARDRGQAMARTMQRRDRLAEQSTSFETAGPYARLLVFARDFDPQLASRAWSSFEPAVPVTSEGFATAGAGTVAGYAVLRLLAAPFRRRRKPAAA